MLVAAVEETLVAATYMEVAVEALVAAAMVPWRSWWRRGEERRIFDTSDHLHQCNVKKDQL
jgi:hypothetical protein